MTTTGRIQLADSGGHRRPKARKEEEDFWHEWNHQRDVTAILFRLMGERTEGTNRECPKIMAHGAASAGKDSTLMTLSEKRMALPNIRFCSYCGADRFIDKVTKSQNTYADNHPDYKTWYDRIYITNRLDQVTPHSILYISEGEMELNNMVDSMDSTEFGQGVNIMSHQDITVLVCTQKNRVIPTLREACEVHIYKRMSPAALANNYYWKPPFVERYAEKFKELDCMFGYIESEFRFGHWKPFRGVIKFDLFQEVPWWGADVSESYADMSLSTSVNTFTRQMSEVPAISMTLFNRFRAHKKIPARAIRAYIRRKYKPGDAVYLTRYPLLGYVLDEMSYAAFDLCYQCPHFNPKFVLEDGDQRCAVGALDDGLGNWNCDQFAGEEDGAGLGPAKGGNKKPVLTAAKNFSDFFEENAQVDAISKAIIANYLRRLSIRKIVDEVSRDHEEITRYEVLKVLGDGSSVARLNGETSRIIGDVFEWWCAFVLGVPLERIPELCASDLHTPDLIWNNEIYSFKWRNNTTDKRLKWLDSDVAPEWAEATRLGQSFHLVETNLGWGYAVRMVDVDPQVTKVPWYSKPVGAAWALTEGN